MKRHLRFPIILLIVCCLATQFHRVMAISPQDAPKAMLKLLAYNAKGELLRSGTAFFINQEGEVATSYTLIADADSVDVVDYKGNRWQLARITGANATIDLAKFTLKKLPKNYSYFTLTQEAATSGTTSLYLPHYVEKKKEQPVAVTILSDEPYNAYKYYQLSAANDSVNFSCPVIDGNGTLMAITQRNVSPQAKNLCAIDARFIGDLKIEAASALNTDLRDLRLPIALPRNAQDASTYMYMLSQSDARRYLTACNDYITAWPDSTEGYILRANWSAKQGKYQACEEDYAKALELSQRFNTSQSANDIHFAISNLIYRTVAERTDTTPIYPGWTLTRAKEEAEKAYQLKSYPLYLMQKGNCQFALRDYEGAYQSYLKTCEDKVFASPETYYSAAMALAQTGRDTLGVVTLLDSCLSHMKHPVISQEAGYLLEHAKWQIRIKQYRQAVWDYNEYEKAIGPKNLTHTFYYLRSQAEMAAKMYQQALDDIHTAIVTTSSPLPYRLEEAYMYLRIGEFEQSLTKGEALLKDLPESPDCHKIIGISLGEMGKKVQALQHLNKALELGDDTVKTFIQKYQETGSHAH